MATWADEISAIIENSITGFGGHEVETASVGTVISVQDGIARVYGLQDVKYLELVEFPRTGIRGLAFNLEEETVSCPILGDFTRIKEEDEVRTTGQVVAVAIELHRAEAVCHRHQRGVDAQLVIAVVE